ncbi:uncharacterized protein LOC128224585 [Mya arenaria]|uniref:uncharacterized protein LOC128224585 n=1 Tax=Mya arenaria TaxID=6604 RepID=UPI0022E21AEE|nr:uncharacterized protein LOC128224585 [Mya arenaria]
MSSPGLRSHIGSPSSFEAAYVRQLEQHYDIDVDISDSSSHKRTAFNTAMGLTNSSPSKRQATNGNIPKSPNKETSLKLEKIIEMKRNSDPNPLHSSDLRNIINMRKRKVAEAEDASKAKPKKRKINNVSRLHVGVEENDYLPVGKAFSEASINGVIQPRKMEEKQPFSVAFGSQPSNVSKQSARDFTEIKDLNTMYSFADEEISFKTPCTYEGKAHSSPVKSSVLDPSLLDQNLNKISSCIKSENLQQLYGKKLKHTSPDSSPFKGKLSAFEISLLKGRQNVERRKSMESANIRSSPRAVRLGGHRPNYNETKTYKRKLSLTNEVDSESLAQFGKFSPHRRKSGKGKVLQEKNEKKTKHRRTISGDKVKWHNTESKVKEKIERRGRPRKTSLDSLVTDRNISTHSGKGRGSISRVKEDKQTGNKVTYRMNGFRKRQSLPEVLTLKSLMSNSGTQDNNQGKPSRSYRKLHAESISGTPPPIQSHSVDEPIPSSSSSTQASASSKRPLSLPIQGLKQSPGKSTSKISINDDGLGESSSCEKTLRRRKKDRNYSESADTNDKHLHSMVEETEENNQKVGGESSSERGLGAAKASLGHKKCKKLSLEETVNMLRKSSANKYKDLVQNKNNLSPSRSERSSRLSSRSSTPSFTPVKSVNVLTPSSEPSTPEKSLSGELVPYKKKKGKPYLFAKGDDVSARWHDGRFYLGKILKIDDSNQRCLLRYDDDSEYWSLFKDIHRVLEDDEMICCVCLGETSEKPNEIVLCEYCLQGYHQQCHRPEIEDDTIADPNDPWLCRNCVFLSTVRLGGAIKTGKLALELKKMKQVLPYDLNSLTWDAQHKNNIDQSYCYCGAPGVWYQKMLQCCRCKQWFHEACMQCLDYPLMFSDTFYIFVCAPCNYGNEYIKRLDVEWLDILHICLFNLAVVNRRKYHNLETEVIGWLDDNWDALQISKYNDLSDRERQKIIEETLEAHKDRFKNASEFRQSQTLWGLRVKVPPPRIHVTLPSNQEVTDQMVAKHKIKGRRSKVLYVENVSPVNKLTDSPIHRDIAAKKKIKLEQDHQSPSKSRKLKKSVPFLDRFIPHDDLGTLSWENHPFLHPVESNVLKAENEVKRKIWAIYRKMAEVKVENEDVESNCTEDGPPVLERVEPLVLNSNCSTTPPMPEIKDKKPGRLSLQPPDALEKFDAKNLKKDVKINVRHSRKVKSRVSAPPVLNVKDEENEIYVKCMREYKNYFCAFDKNGYLNGFYLTGKQIISEGNIHYLVKWDH